MQFIQPQRSKYKKSTKNYVQDNLLDIIDIEETLLKNRYITKVQKSDFLYTKFLPKNETLKPLTQQKPIILKPLSKEKMLPVKDAKLPQNNNKNINKNINDNNNNINEQKKLLYNIDNINFDILNKNKFDINFKKLKIEYKNGYRVLFIDEYFPIEIIGSGSFGLVVNVIEIKTLKKMAVKIINKNNANYNSDADYVNNEVHILNNLDNPRIMKIYDILDNHHYFFIFMELIEGGNLKDLIIKRYMSNNIYLFRDSECSQIMKGILEAINYLHKRNIIHRDIKPENILFKNKDDLSSVILCDFGLARQLSEYENSISGSCGTTIYMAPEILLKKNYDYLVDSFSAGIVLYILCSGGMHPFYKKGTSQKEYTEKILQQKCLCKFSPEMPLLARNLFLKLCKFEPIFRYQAYKALNHPWITRSTKSQIPMTILEEYNKSDKIKTFHALLSSVVSLVVLKRHFKIKKKKDEIEKNNSFYENFERTSIKSNNMHQIFNMNMNINMQDKFILLSSMKKNSKVLFVDNKEEKRISPKKLSSINHPNGFNIKTTKNSNKKLDPPILSKPNFFVKTGMSYNKNNNGNILELRNSLRTHSFKESEKQKEQQKNISKSKTHSKYKQMKSSSGNIVINNIIANKDNKDNGNTIQYSASKKSGNNILTNLNNGNGTKNSNVQNNKIFLKKHIVIESKNKNMINDTRKNNNSINSSNNNKNNPEGNGNNYINYNYGSNNGNNINFNNNINLQINNKNNNYKDYNQISNYQNIFNGSKYKSKNLVLKEVINNNDF